MSLNLIPLVFGQSHYKMSWRFDNFICRICIHLALFISQVCVSNIHNFMLPCVQASASLPTSSASLTANYNTNEIRTLHSEDEFLAQTAHWAEERGTKLWLKFGYIDPEKYLGERPQRTVRNRITSPEEASPPAHSGRKHRKTKMGSLHSQQRSVNSTNCKMHFKGSEIFLW